LHASLALLRAGEHRWTDGVLGGDFEELASLSAEDCAVRATENTLVPGSRRQLRDLATALATLPDIEPKSQGSGVPSTATRLWEDIDLRSQRHQMVVDFHIGLAETMLVKPSFCISQTVQSAADHHLADTAEAIRDWRADQLSRVPNLLRFTDTREGIALLEGEVLSDWLLLTAGGALPAGTVDTLTTP
jgi:hypothetical protein